MGLRIRNLDYDSYPCVLHHGGGDLLCRAGLELKRRCFDLTGDPRQSFSFSKSGKLSALQVYRRPRARHPLRRIPNLAIVTFTSFRHPGSAELSVQHLGVQIDVLRPARRWNHLLKIPMLRSYLEGLDTEYVLFMDSHDAFVTSDLLGIVDRFQKLGCRLLFQADALDWPPHATDFYRGIAAEAAKYRYLCSGIFMGETAFLKRVVERASDTAPIADQTDQGIYKQVFPEFHPEARIDYHCELFQPLTDYRDPRRPDRFQPADLNLEIQFRADADAATDLRSISPRSYGAATRLLWGRLRAAVTDRISGRRTR